MWILRPFHAIGRFHGLEGMSEVLECGVGIIGAGYTAREHIRAFQDIPGIRIKGIHSRTRARAESVAEEFGLPNVCNSVTDVYGLKQVDLIVVAVSELSLPEVAGECFQYSWTVLMEKPP